MHFHEITGDQSYFEIFGSRREGNVLSQSIRQ